MPRSDEARIRDILGAGARIRQHIGQLDRAAFAGTTRECVQSSSAWQ